jgi:TonB family protein
MVRRYPEARFLKPNRSPVFGSLRSSLICSVALHLGLALVCYVGLQRSPRFGDLVNPSSARLDRGIFLEVGLPSRPSHRSRKMPLPVPAPGFIPTQVGGAPGGGEIVSNGTADTMAILKINFLTELRAAIQNKMEYPALARARRQTGRVAVGFTLCKDGRIENVHLVESSSQERLDTAALESVEDLGRFRPIPDSISKKDWNIIIPLDFKMTE